MWVCSPEGQVYPGLHCKKRGQHIEGAYKKAGDRLFSRACRDKTSGNGFNLKEDRFRVDIRKNFFYNEGGETLEQVAERDGICPIPVNIQGQAGRGL